MSDNSSVVLLFPPGMSLLQFGSKVYPRKFLFQGFWQFRWVLWSCFFIAFQKNADEKSKGRCCLICCRTMETHLFFCKLLLYRNLHWVKSWFSLTKFNTYSNSKHSVWNCAANEKIFRKGMFSTCDICQLIRGTCKVSNIGLSTYFILQIYSCQLDFVQYFHLRLSLPSWLSSSSTRPSLGQLVNL